MRHTNYLLKYLNVQMQTLTDKTMENCYIQFHGPMVGFYRRLPDATSNEILLLLLPMTQLVTVEEIENARIRSLSS